jgi:hypothetical protein
MGTPSRCVVDLFDVAWGMWMPPEKRDGGLSGAMDPNDS